MNITNKQKGNTMSTQANHDLAERNRLARKLSEWERLDYDALVRKATDGLRITHSGGSDEYWEDAPHGSSDFHVCVNCWKKYEADNPMWLNLQPEHGEPMGVPVYEVDNGGHYEFMFPHLYFCELCDLRFELYHTPLRD